MTCRSEGPGTVSAYRKCWTNEHPLSLLFSLAEGVEALWKETRGVSAADFLRGAGVLNELQEQPYPALLRSSPCQAALPHP